MIERMMTNRISPDSPGLALSVEREWGKFSSTKVGGWRILEYDIPITPQNCVFMWRLSPNSFTAFLHRECWQNQGKLSIDDDVRKISGMDA